MRNKTPNFDQDRIVREEINLSLEMLQAVQYQNPAALEVALAKRHALGNLEKDRPSKDGMGVIYL